MIDDEVAQSRRELERARRAPRTDGRPTHSAVADNFSGLAGDWMALRV